ncbi:HPr(Ser) kinase/phosphatase [Bacillus toyonensis]|uniref:HPr(Ser) kinase/phosphatase n=1 Tax=Bacillus toyonensis TaxID=155322 RepID=UPI002E201774|nr:HPr(Ser) kinase/phosphatase [Bacillus toyonensis]MED2737226.1 HPr(Ser) kinase/phosphatase [Bacillus toyonensis]
MKNLTLKQLQEEFQLEILAGDNELNKEIYSEEIHRPGLEVTGFYEYFPKERIQLMGKQETTYLFSLKEKEQKERIRAYLKLQPVCIIVTRGLEVTDFFIEQAKSEGVVIFRTNDKTTNFMSSLYSYLQKNLAQEMTVHGVCVNVYGVGVLIRGTSGIGKSEIALSLIERGHRLVSDDIVLLKKIGPVALIGTHNDVNSEFLSLRGIGFINVLRLYGSGAIQNETKINLDIYLSPWDDEKQYDAVGIDNKKSEYLETEIPLLEIPIRPGRDIASLIEVAAKNWRLQQQGYNTLDDFYSRFDQ